MNFAKADLIWLLPVDFTIAQDDFASASEHTSLNPRRENAVERLNLGLDDFSEW